MTDRRLRGIAALSACMLTMIGCGPSGAELRDRAERDELRRELVELRQYEEDLKFRLQLANARNKLLLGLVQGLTIDPDHFAPQPEKLATADASLASIDRDVEALIATVRTSRQDANALRAQREALQRELSDARRTIEEARTAQADVDARMLALQRILAPLNALVRAGRVNVSIAYGRLSIQLPEAALFAPNQSALSEDGRALLSRVVVGLQTAPDRSVSVAGPSDPLTKRASAQRELTLARSVAVLDFLKQHGANAESSVTTEHALSPAGRPDRYFALTLVPKAEELPRAPSPEQLLPPANGTAPAGAAAPTSSAPGVAPDAEACAGAGARATCAQ
jgi:flagellar motor protein MotB